MATKARRGCPNRARDSIISLTRAGGIAAEAIIPWQLKRGLVAQPELGIDHHRPYMAYIKMLVKNKPKPAARWADERLFFPMRPPNNACWF